jgi:hypothetical protein
MTQVDRAPAIGRAEAEIVARSPHAPTGSLRAAATR